MVTEVKVNALGLPVGLIEPTKLEDNDLIQVKTKFDAKTGSTEPVEEKLDFQKLIASYEDQAGIEYMIKQVKLGAVPLSALADDGKHSADVSGVADNIDDAYQNALVAKSDQDKILTALGLDASATPDQIKSALAGIYEKAQADKNPKKEEVKDNAE